MSARTIKSLHPTTWASIQMQDKVTGGLTPDQWWCGCSRQKDGKVWLCTYHDGCDDGAWAVETAEENLRALRIGRAVLASLAIPSMDGFAEAYRLGWNHCRETFLDAGDDDE